MPDISDGAAFDDYAPDDWEWECWNCGHVFSAASAWSEGDGDSGGVICPNCGEFVSDEEL